MEGGGGENPPKSVFKQLAYRFQSLEASQNKLKEQFDVLLQEKFCGSKDSEENEVASDSADVTSFHGWACVPGAYFSESPYKRMLEQMGHAVYVSAAGTGEIIFWNHAAEKLFGYKDYEVIGRVVELHFDEERHQSAEDIIERWSTGKSWSGQLTLRKRSGQIFNAMVTKSPLYEDGQLIGIINVSSDAHIFNNVSSEHLRTHHDDDDDDQPQARKINCKKSQWHQQPQIAAVPQLASSVSNLASTFLLHKRGDAACNTCRTTKESEEAEVQCQATKPDKPPRAPMAKPIFNLSIGNRKGQAESSEQEKSTFEFSQPSKIAAKVLSKLHIGGISKKLMDENSQKNSSDDFSKNKEVENETYSPRASMENVNNLDSRNPEDNSRIQSRNAVARKHLNMHLNPANTIESSHVRAFSDEYCKLPRASLRVNEKEFVTSMDVEDVSPKQSSSPKFTSSEGSDGMGQGSMSSRDDSESQMVVDCEILWEDIQFREEIGQSDMKELTS